MRWSSSRSAAVVVCIALCRSASAIAGDPTPEDRAAARTVAEQGNTAFQEGRFADALDMFRRAEALLHAPTHLLMLARTQVALGQLVVAKETYLQITRESLAATAPEPFKRAQADAKSELTALEPRIPTVVVTVRGGADQRGEVTMDGKPVAEALLGVARPVDPGPHVFRASAPGLVADEKKVTVRERERLAVDLELHAARAPAPIGPRSTSPPPSRDESQRDAGASDGPGPMRPLAIAMIGVGVVGVGVGTVFAVLATGSRSDADDAYARCGDPCPPGPLQDEVRSLDDEGSTRSTVAVISLVAGAAFAGGGVALLLASGSRKRDTSRAAAPWIGLGRVGVAGRF